MMRRFFSTYLLHRRMSGFTLTELIVVLALVVMSSTIVLFNYRGSRGMTVLTSTAYDIASVFRTAAAGGRNSSQNNTGYDLTYGDTNDPGQNPIGSRAVGVYINVNATKVESLTLYRELNNNMGYQAATDALLQVFSVDTPQATVRLCDSGTDITANVACGHFSTDSSIDFSRLDNEPRISSAYDTELSGTNDMPIIQIAMNIAGVTNYRYVVIEKTGNIFIK